MLRQQKKWKCAPTSVRCQINTKERYQLLNTHLISDSKSFSRSLSNWFGRAAISQSILGRQESRSVSEIFVLLAAGVLVNVILLPKPLSSSSMTSCDVSFRMLFLRMCLASSLSSSSSTPRAASFSRYWDHLAPPTASIASGSESIGCLLCRLVSD